MTEMTYFRVAWAGVARRYFRGSHPRLVWGRAVGAKKEVANGPMGQVRTGRIGNLKFEISKGK